MKIGKVVSIFLLAVLFLGMIMFAIPTKSQSTAPYDPWADQNGDGIIDMYDIGYPASQYLAEGDPTKPVEVQALGWNESHYQFTVAPHTDGSVSVATSGYKQATLGVDASAPGAIGGGPIDVSTGFLLGSRYAYVDKHTVTTEGLITPHNGNAMWIEPSATAIPSVIGHRFNLTVWVNTTENSFMYQFRLYFNQTYFGVTGSPGAWRIGFTGGATSQFFQGHYTGGGPTLVDNEAGWAMAGETLNGSDYREPGYGSLTWTEFEVKAVPPEPQNFSINNQHYTYVRDPDSFFIPLTMYDTAVSVLDETLFPEHSAVGTYSIVGSQLIVACFNPYDFSVTLDIDVYLTC